MTDQPPFAERPPGAMPPPPPDEEFVWSFRGYHLRASEFTTAMVHFHRAEVQRANVWRQRLDTTTNWAVVTTGAVLSFAFGQGASHHYVIILNLMLVTIFLFLEARRYRYYEVWAYRIRLMETDFFAAMLVPPFHPAADWAESLAENLLQPHFPISYLEAIGRRLRRNYIWIYAVIGAAWVARLWLFPNPITFWEGFVQRAAIGTIPGYMVVAGVAVFFVIIALTAILTIQMHEASGEVLPHFANLPAEGGLSGLANQAGKAARGRPWFRPSKRRQQLLTLIITDVVQPVSQSVMDELHRGVTAIPGVGMFTGKDHKVLMCALTVTEVNQLKTLVKKVDPKAFIIVMPAQEVLGRGFSPLQTE